MNVKRAWLKFNEENVQKVPEVHGVYEIAHVTSNGRELWRLGHAPNLRGRLLTRLREPAPPRNCYFRYYEAGVSEDLEALEAKLFDSYRRSTSEA
ncbi:MAG: DUF7508 domain-containing protein [Chloroflexota bacterium]